VACGFKKHQEADHVWVDLALNLSQFFLLVAADLI
jgi:hypothetical protein